MREPFRKASVYIAVLLVLEALIGLGIIVTTVYYQTILSGYLSEMERKMLCASLTHIYMLGFQIVVLFICSLTIWNRLWPRRCTPNVQMLLTIWLLFCLLIIFCGFIMVLSLFNEQTVLEHAAESSLTHGIDLYYSCPEWKLLWDSLQLHKQCCGVHTYKDWMNAEWMPRQEDSCSSMGDGSVLAPYTCCKRTCPDCFQNYGPQIPNAGGRGGSAGNSARGGAIEKPFPTINIEYINQNGCLSVFVDTLWRYLYTLIVLIALALKFMIILFCLTKYIIYKQSDCKDVPNLTDDAGRPLVVVKYPANVRCIALGEDDLASDIPPADNNYCHCDQSMTCDDGMDFFA